MRAISLLLLLAVFSIPALGQQKEEPKKPVATISAAGAKELGEAEESIREAQRETEKRMLLQRVRYLELVLESMGVKINDFDLKPDGKGGIQLVAKPPKTEAKKE
jgi:hypothetical protein